MGDNNHAAKSHGGVPTASSSSPTTTKRGEVLETETEAEVRRRMRALPRLKDGQLSLACEWGECGGVVSVSLKDCFQHVSLHIQQYLMQVLGPAQRHSLLSGGLCLTCGWRDCGAQILGSVIDYNRHVYFHVLHVHLKGMGAHLVRELKLGVCLLGRQSCNWIPELPDNLKCLWGQCQIIFDNPYHFYSHVGHHTEEFEDSQSTYKCQWDGCQSRVRDQNKLKDHLKSHTQEKQVACPTCGGLFSSPTKLTDHILRQATSQLLRYECSHCNRRFSTERMLREHMRRHVNTYKCPMCQMTCPSPSTLRMHIRYKHSDDKPFKCGHCEFSAKSSTDLRKHLDSHNVEDQFSCHIANCPFSARSYNSLALHFKKHHESVEVSIPRYICHVCQRVFVRGYNLTHHLKTKHHFQWPPGHSRFRYKLHGDGYLRLQTVRYECADLEELPSQASDKRSTTRVRPKKRIIATAVTSPQLPDDSGREENAAESSSAQASSARGGSTEETLPEESTTSLPLSSARAGKRRGAKKRSAATALPSRGTSQAAGASDNPEEEPSSEQVSLVTANTQQRNTAPGTLSAGEESSAARSPRKGRKRGRKTTTEEAPATGEPSTGARPKRGRKQTLPSGEEPSGEAPLPAVSGQKRGRKRGSVAPTKPLRPIRKKGTEELPSHTASPASASAALTASTEQMPAPQQQETFPSDQQQRPPAFTRSTSLDECPPQMVDIRWLDDKGRPKEGSGCYNGSATTDSGTVVVGVSGGGASPMSALNLQVAHYGDSAEANLHMLGDVALTSLRASKLQ